MPRRKRVQSPVNFEDYDEEFDDDDCSNGAKNQQNFPMYRNAANARERARMRVLSSAFSRLKTKLPWVPADTKLSKLDTLRLATIYIQQLSACLTKDDNQYYAMDANSQSINENQPSLVWPFTFQHHSIEASRSAASVGQWLTRDSNDVYRPFDTASYGNSASNINNNNGNSHVKASCIKSGTGTGTIAGNIAITQMMNNSTAHG